MIITRVYGGLGNQLFKYYAGLGFAHRLGRRLLIDMGSTLQPHCRPYALAEFGLGKGINIEEQKTKEAIFKTFDLYQRTALEQHFGKQLYKVINEKSSSYYSEDCLDQAEGSCICLLDGYWQSWKYFAGLPIGEFLKLKMSTPVSEKHFREIVSSAGGELESYVALHIRRGDMKLLQNLYQLADFAYYRAAIDMLSSKIKNPRFVIFSDDWEDPISQELDSLFKGRITKVQSNEMSDYDSFRLMSKFRSHILANSTFGWWAAYLAERLNPGHLWTITPEQWYANKEWDNRDLIPEHWICIKRET